MPLWIIPMQALTPYPTSKDTMLTVPRFLCEPSLVNLFPLKDSCDFVHPFRASLRAPCGICQLKCSSELEYEWNSDSDRQSKRKNMSALFSTNFAKLPPLPTLPPLVHLGSDNSVGGSFKVFLSENWLSLCLCKPQVLHCLSICLSLSGSPPDAGPSSATPHLCREAGVVPLLLLSGGVWGGLTAENTNSQSEEILLSYWHLVSF